MYNVLYEHNRTYYRNIFRIKCKRQWQLFKLALIGQLLKLAYKIDGKLFNDVVVLYAEKRNIYYDYMGL